MIIKMLKFEYAWKAYEYLTLQYFFLLFFLLFAIEFDEVNKSNLLVD